MAQFNYHKGFSYTKGIIHEGGYVEYEGNVYIVARLEKTETYQKVRATLHLVGTNKQIQVTAPRQSFRTLSKK